MAKITGENLTRWVRHICGASVEDGIFYIRKEESLVLLDACLQHEEQHMKRKTMIRNLKARIRKLEMKIKIEEES